MTSNFIPAQDAPPDPEVCTVYLLRHGEVANAHEICLNGHYDVKLSERGQEQSKELAQAFSAQSIHAVYSSDLTRTVTAADMIAHAHTLEARRIPALRELSFGKWEGLPIRELAKIAPGVIEERFENPDTFKAEEGESFQDLQNRVIPAFTEIVEKHLGQTIVIVAHGGVNRIILSHLIGFPLHNIFRISQEYGCVNLIRYKKGSPLVDWMNSTANQIPQPAN